MSFFSVAKLKKDTEDEKMRDSSTVKRPSPLGRGRSFSLKKISILFASLLLLVLLFSVFLEREREIYNLSFEPEIKEASARFDVSSNLIRAVIYAESGFSVTAVSRAGAVGLMQLLPSTALWLAEREGITLSEGALFDAKINVLLGAAYLKYLTERFSDLKTVLAAYNAGEGTVRGWLQEKRWSEDGKTLKEVPFSETERYIRRVFKTFLKYNKKFGE